ncbi:MAG: hypothetical protein U1F15_08945 [Burkholderiales bacterium]
MAQSPLVECRAGDILTSDQIIAIGKVAIEWGMLEFVLGAHGQNLCRVYPGMAFNILTRKPSGTVLAGILAELSAFFLPVPVAEDFRKIMQRVQDVGGDRNDVVHGVWNLTSAALGRLSAESEPMEPALNAAIKANGWDFSMSTWTTAELHDLAERIAQIRLDLNRLLDPLPAPLGRNYDLAEALAQQGDPATLAAQFAAKAAHVAVSDANRFPGKQRRPPFA